LRKSLEDHFNFWNSEFNQILNTAIECIVALKKGRRKKAEAYDEMLNNILILSPRNTQDIHLRYSTMKIVLHIEE